MDGVGKEAGHTPTGHEVARGKRGSPKCMSEIEYFEDIVRFRFECDMSSYVS